jgi:hypothetical protein
MSIHSTTALVEQDRSSRPVVNGLVEGAADGGWEGYEDGLVAFAVDAEDAVAVFLAEVGDVRAGGFEDPQAQEAEHGDECEVVPVGRPTRCGEDGFELQMPQPEGRGVSGHVWPSHVLGRRHHQHGIQHTGAVEPADHRQPAGHR